MNIKKIKIAKITKLIQKLRDLKIEHAVITDFLLHKKLWFIHEDYNCYYLNYTADNFFLETQLNHILKKIKGKGYRVSGLFNLKKNKNKLLKTKHSKVAEVRVRSFNSNGIFSKKKYKRLLVTLDVVVEYFDHHKLHLISHQIKHNVKFPD